MHEVIHQPILLDGKVPEFPNSIPRDFDLVMQTSVGHHETTRILPLTTTAPPVHPPLGRSVVPILDEKTYQIKFSVREADGAIKIHHQKPGIEPALAAFDLVWNGKDNNFTTPADNAHAILVFSANAKAFRPRPVSPEEEAKIQQLITRANWKILNISSAKLTIGYESMERLIDRPIGPNSGWLTSESLVYGASVINRLIPTVFCLTPYQTVPFSDDLHAEQLLVQYHDIPKWINGRTLNKLLFLINKGNTDSHWCLFVLNLRDHKLSWYDSLTDSDPGDGFLDRIAPLVGEVSFDDSWERDWPPKDKVYQPDAKSCGVIALLTGLFVAADLDVRGIDTRDLRAWRMALASSIVKNDPASPFHFFL